MTVVTLLSILLTVFLSVAEPLSSAPKALTPRVFLPMIQSHPSKFGIGKASPDQVFLLGGSWTYNWGNDPPYGWGVEGVPMIWDEQHMNFTQYGNSTWLMGFNEPDLCPPEADQACMSPAFAAGEWRKIEQRYPTKKLVAPAPSHLHPEWLTNFRDTYHYLYGTYPRLDALAMHCYFWTASACIAQGQYFIGLAQAWGVPEVWVTEFAFLPGKSATWESDIANFLAWMDAEPMIGRYAVYVGDQACPSQWWWECGPNDPSLFYPGTLIPTPLGLHYDRDGS